METADRLRILAAPRGWRAACTDVFRLLMAHLGHHPPRAGAPAFAALAAALLAACGSGAPVTVQPQHLVVDEDGVLDGTVVAKGGGAALAFSAARRPGHGAVEVDGRTGGFRYRPEPDFFGEEVFVVAATDYASVDTAAVTIDVRQVADAPQLWDSWLVVDEDTGGALLLVGTDADGDALTYTLVEGPGHGTASLDPESGALTYLPERNWSGRDLLRVTASDGRLVSRDALVSIDVLSVNDAPVAEPFTLVLSEDGNGASRVEATDEEGDPLTFRLDRPPEHGTLAFEPDGSFSYVPDPDFAGNDGFDYSVDDGALEASATVTLAVMAVNDPPRLPTIPDQTNSAETLETFLALPSRDVDGDALVYRVTVEDPEVAAAQVDATGTLVVTPSARGATSLRVAATDGVLEAEVAFIFTVTEVTKLRRFALDVPRERALRIENVADHPVEFVLEHEGHRLATTADELLAEVLASPEDFTGEPFERKLWRLVRDGTYHGTPFSGDYWTHDPLLLLSSIGFGYCDDVSAAYTTLARDAGLTARAWELEGHVVPEVERGGAWAMFDPDLAIYYLRRDGAVAGVEDLASDPSLILDPATPLREDTWVYGSTVAGIYESSADNHVVYGEFYVEAASRPALSLPAGGVVTYPALWSEPPSTVTGVPVGHASMLRLDLPPGFEGSVAWPLVLWDVQGRGTVRLGGTTYAVGSSELTSALHRVGGNFAAAGVVEVVETAEQLALVYLLNPVRFGLAPTTSIALSSEQAWALDVRSVALPPASRLRFDDLSELVRPR